MLDLFVARFPAYLSFTRQLEEDLAYCRQHGYKARKGNRYLQMLRRHRELETARRLLRSNVPRQIGLKDVAKLGLLGYSLEARVVAEPWCRLFSAVEINEAPPRRLRLRHHDTAALN